MPLLATAATQSQVRAYKRRPIFVLRKRRLRLVLMAWWALSEERRNKRAKLAKAAGHLRNQQVLKAWNTWHAPRVLCDTLLLHHTMQACCLQ